MYSKYCAVFISNLIGLIKISVAYFQAARIIALTTS